MEKTVIITDKLSVFFDIARYTNYNFSNIDVDAEAEKYPLKSEIKRYVTGNLSIVFAKNKFSDDFTFSRLGSSMVEPLYESDGKLQA